MASAAQRTALLARLDAIEAEMRRLGMWRAPGTRPTADGPLGPAGFEAWLQDVFLPKARRAVAADALPDRSQVGLMALRQYDYHTHVPEAAALVALLHDVDDLVSAARETKS